jgi:single-strand DNA-binding protein
VYATTITITGNVLTTPARRRIEGGASVTTFRVASTERKFVRQLGEWADGDSLFLKVNCWRDLADNVDRCVAKGDPVVVTGRIYTREYEVEGQRRSSFEVEADAIGLNLAKGTCAFSRTRPSAPTYQVESPELAGQALGDEDGEFGEQPSGDAAALVPDEQFAAV